MLQNIVFVRVFLSGLKTYLDQIYDRLVSIIQMGSHIELVNLVKDIPGNIPRKIFYYAYAPPCLYNRFMDMTLAVKFANQDHSQVFVFRLPVNFNITKEQVSMTWFCPRNFKL